MIIVWDQFSLLITHLRSTIENNIPVQLFENLKSNILAKIRSCNVCVWECVYACMYLLKCVRVSLFLCVVEKISERGRVEHN